MKLYHYATISLETFAPLTKVPQPKDSYVASDIEAEELRKIANGGYRLHSIDHEMHVAIFEREIEGLPPRVRAALEGQPSDNELLNEVATALRALVDANGKMSFDDFVQKYGFAQSAAMKMARQAIESYDNRGTK